MARLDSFHMDTGQRPSDTTPTPSPSPTSDTSTYDPSAAYASPGGFGLSQVGKAIGDTVSRYGTPAVSYIGNTFLGVDDFKRIPDEIRNREWRNLAKSTGTGAAELGITMFGGEVVRGGASALGFAAGKLGKFVPALESAPEVGGRLITGVQKKAAGLVGAAVIGFSPIAHGIGDFAPRAASSISHVIGEAPSAARGAIDAGVGAVERGVQGAAPVVEHAAQTVARDASTLGKNAVNAIRSAVGVNNADSTNVNQDTNTRDQQQQQQQQQQQNNSGPLPKPNPKPELPKDPGKEKKTPNLGNFDVSIPGQNAQITRTY